MSNHPIVGINFEFFYDGTTSTVLVDTHTGPINYVLANSTGLLAPTFSATATSVTDTSMVDSIGTAINSSATIASNGVMTVTVPHGLVSGSIFVGATLLYG